MSKRVLFAAVLAFSVFAGTAWAQPPVGWAPEGSPVAQHGRLKVDGNKLVNERGNAVQLRGMSLGWTSDTEHNYYAPEVVAWLADDWRVSVVRAAMGVGDTGPCANPGQGFCTHPEQNERMVTTVVDAAIWQGIYVIIDWHSHFASDQQEESRAGPFFRRMAERYKDYPNVIYEVFNEPGPVVGNDGAATGQWTTAKAYSERMIDIIRAHDPLNLIIVPTPGYCQRLGAAFNNPINPASRRTNMLYALHFYCDHFDGTDNWQIPFTNNVNRMPLFATEIGISRSNGDGFCDGPGRGNAPNFTAADHPKRFKDWLEALEQNGVSWAAWQISTKAESSTVLRYPGLLPNGTVIASEISRLRRGGWGNNDLSAAGRIYREILRGGNTQFGSAANNRGYRSTIAVEPAGGGSVSGTGNHAFGAAVTLTANPAQNFRHEGWIINNAVHATEPITYNAYHDRRGTAVFFPTNLLTNSTFTATINPWTRGTVGFGGVVIALPTDTMIGQERVARINVTQANADNQQNGWLSHPGLTIQNGGKYRLSFKARTASGTRTITPAIRTNTAHVMNITDPVTISASATMPSTAHTFEFQATGNGTTLAFYCGNVVGEWFIDDVLLELLEVVSTGTQAIVSVPFRAALTGNALTLTGASGKTAEVTVYDLTGRVRLSESVSLSGHNAVSLTRLPAGVYTVRYKIDGVIQPQRERIMLAR